MLAFVFSPRPIWGHDEEFLSENQPQSCCSISWYGKFFLSLNTSNYTISFRPYFSECVDGRYCQCKSNVEGVLCDRCRQGTFGLQESNPLGCTQCWCSGVANDCSVATMYWSTLRLPFFDDNHEVILRERWVRKMIPLFN